MVKRVKSSTRVNSKIKPASIGKLGPWKVGDKFKDNNGYIYEIISIDSGAYIPYTLHVNNGNTGMSYTALKKLKQIWINEPERILVVWMLSNLGGINNINHHL